MRSYSSVAGTPKFSPSEKLLFNQASKNHKLGSWNIHNQQENFLSTINKMKFGSDYNFKQMQLKI